MLRHSRLFTCAGEVPPKICPVIMPGMETRPMTDIWFRLGCIAVITLRWINGLAASMREAPRPIISSSRSLPTSADHQCLRVPEASWVTDRPVIKSRRSLPALAYYQSLLNHPKASVHDLQLVVSSRHRLRGHRADHSRSLPAVLSAFCSVSGRMQLARCAELSVLDRALLRGTGDEDFGQV